MTGAADLYLNLMKRCLLSYVYPEAEQASGRGEGLSHRALNKVRAVVARKAPDLVRDANMKMPRPPTFSAEARRVGRDWPRYAHTLIGEERLDNLRRCIEDVLERGVSGDLCRQAVEDYRAARGIRDAIVPIDWTGVYWRGSS